MKKQKEKKQKSKICDNKCQQLSLHNFFFNKNIKALTEEQNANNINKEIETKNSTIEDENHIERFYPSSFNIINSSPELKSQFPFSKFSSSDIHNKEDLRSTSKKRLFHDTLNSYSDYNTITETKNIINNKNSINVLSTSAESDTVDELLELENFPPKQEEIIISKSDTVCTDSVVLPIKYNKRLKLSWSNSKKNKFESKNRKTKFDTSSLKKNSIKDQSIDKDDAVQQININNRLMCEELSCTPATLDHSKAQISEVQNNNKLTDIKKIEYDLFDIENLGDLFDENWNSHELRGLNLAEWNHCVITKIEVFSDGFMVRLREANKNISSSSTDCIIKGYWGDSPLSVDDVINIKARYDEVLNHWVVDEKEGFVIKYPNILVTGTGIVGSLFCLRQAVLNYLFPGLDPPNVSMLIGSLVHELLQEILKKKCYSEMAMREIVTGLIRSQKTLRFAYEYNVSLSTLQMELDQFLPRIMAFIDIYITEKKVKGKTWSGIIEEILSIEENFWLPELGIKGKTDIIIKANHNGNIKTMPVELKTGRASNSAEHRGQIILYLMMMSELGMNVDSGLLLYLRENILTEIKPHHSECKGLITTRNNLVNYYKKNESIFLSTDEKFDPPILPEPINHHSGCAKCPYLTICSAVLSEKPDKEMHKSNPLNVLSISSIKHLSNTHIRYVFHWLGLLKLEEMERKKMQFSDISDIWHLDINKRQTRGNCISKLVLVDIKAVGNKFLHLFKSPENDYNFTSSHLINGDYIVISDDTRYAIAAGYVHNISQSSICLKIDRELIKKKNPVYVVDKYTVSERLLHFNTSSLALLLENSDSAARLRSFIIDFKIPLFTSISNVLLEKNKSVLYELNVSQREAVLKTIAAKDYMLIKGMPGTGKTATIVALVKLLVRLNYTILITSHTHSAVDNILLQLCNDINCLRLGSNTKVHPALKPYCEDIILKNYNFQSVEDVNNFYNKKQVVGVTCMGCSHMLLKKRKFDYCIVDEATQILLPSIIKALYSSRKFVLLGDPEQLPPVVQSKEASRLGFDESLFTKLDRLKIACTLYIQYRMNSEIMRLANLFVYKNSLQCNSDKVNSATIDCCYSPVVINEHNWLESVLSSRLKHSVLFLNVSNLKGIDLTAEYKNQVEADIAFIIVNALKQTCKQIYDIGIIAPYRDQVELLRKISISKNYNDIEINTVDQYQGRDKDIIIYSCTIFSNPKEGGILADKRRLTVAITRAKRKLILIGNIQVLQNYSTFKHLLRFISPENIINI